MKHASKIIAIVLIPIGYFGVTVGLTYATCYATVCSEDFLPRETRVHLGSFYLMLAIFGLALLLRSSFAFLRVLSVYATSFEIPILRKHISVGGLLASTWIVGSTLATTAIWLPSLLDFWSLRTDPMDWTTGKILLTVTGVTGHYADFLMGLLIIPVSRNSLVGRAFGVHHSTLMAAHKLLSYLFAAAVIAHGGTYLTYAMAPLDVDTEQKEHSFAQGNPLMTLEESKKTSFWYTTATYNGIGCLIFVIVIVLTSLPFIRRKNYNTFYYFHCFCGASILIGASIHASTDFYLVFPGLCLYSIDWGMRMFSGEVGGTHNKVEAVVENAGSDWYRVSFSSWNQKIGRSASNLFESSNDNLAYPLKYYYLNTPVISKMQNHPFTAAVPSSSASGPVFLFQRSQGKKQKKLDKEWTWKLGSLVPNQNDRTVVQLRLEGPYPPRNTKFETASHIVCIVGGTGMTGACSLAIWWSKTRASMGDSSFTFVWTIRDRKTSNIQEWKILSEMAARTPRIELVTHVSSEEGRLDPAIHIRRALSLETQEASVVEKNQVDAPASVWVYSAGPDGFTRAVEGACIAARTNVRRNVQATIKDFDWYIAKWEV